jgi:hypothetical protein
MFLLPEISTVMVSPIKLSLIDLPGNGTYYSVEANRCACYLVPPAKSPSLPDIPDSIAQTSLPTIHSAGFGQLQTAKFLVHRDLFILVAARVTFQLSLITIGTT